MRERLIELLKTPHKAEKLRQTGTAIGDYEDDCIEAMVADFLLANGVIVPPCKVGQTVFFYTCVCDKEGEEKFDILEGEVISFSLQEEGFWAYCRYKCGLTYWHLVEQDFGKTAFLTKEEAEEALAKKGGA